jgi:hypothetical protein
MRIDPHRIETENDAGSQYVSPRIGPALGLKDAQLGEQSDALWRRLHTLRDLILGEPVTGHVRL